MVIDDTSGKFFMTTCSTRVEISTDSSSDTDGSLRVSMSSDPSSRRGMNSVPRKGTEPSAAATMVTATAMVASGCRMCVSSRRL